MLNTRSRKGFTLIELLVVTTIIIVLSAIGLVTFQNAGQNARNGKRKADMESIRQALVLYRADQGEYPTGSFSAIADALIAASYLSAPAPTESKSGHDAYSWNGSTSSFCICATMEGDNNPGNSTNTSCVFGTGDYYCAKNP